MSADPTAEHIDAVAEGMRIACSGPVIYRNDVARAILASTDPAVHAALAASLPAEVMLAALVDRGVLTRGQAKFRTLPTRPGDSFSGRAG